MFIFWFSANFNILAFSTGSSGPVFFSLGIKDSLLVILVVDVMCVYSRSLHCGVGYMVYYDVHNFFVWVHMRTLGFQVSLIHSLVKLPLCSPCFSPRSCAVPAYLCVLEIFTGTGNYLISLPCHLQRSFWT